jgi:hypothetical protein
MASPHFAVALGPVMPMGPGPLTMISGDTSLGLLEVSDGAPGDGGPAGDGQDLDEEFNLDGQSAHPADSQDADTFTPFPGNLQCDVSSPTIDGLLFAPTPKPFARSVVPELSLRMCRARSVSSSTTEKRWRKSRPQRLPSRVHNRHTAVATLHEDGPRPLVPNNHPHVVATRLTNDTIIHPDRREPRSCRTHNRSSKYAILISS